MALVIPGSTISSGDRIRQLDKIDQDVVNLLHSAGLAIKSLTRSADMTTEKSVANPQLRVDHQKISFAAATSRYFATLSAIDVRLRRHIYALEEAEILPSEAPSRGDQTNPSMPSGFSIFGRNLNPNPAKASSKGFSSDGGIGGLDVGWLNSRNDHVGKEKESELWEEAQNIIQKILEGKKIHEPDFQ